MLLGVYNFILASNYCPVSALRFFFFRGIINKWKIIISQKVNNKYNICIQMRKYEVYVFNRKNGYKLLICRAALYIELWEKQQELIIV